MSRARRARLSPLSGSEAAIRLEVAPLPAPKGHPAVRLHGGRPGDGEAAVDGAGEWAAPRIGTCGWSMARSRYFQHFNAVEIQQTFYEPPSTATAARWRAQAPAGFAFSVKAWQLVTHPSHSPTYRRLKRTALDENARKRCGFFAPTEEVEAAFRRTLEVADALEARAILFQTPAAFTPRPEHIANLRAFFRSHAPPPGRLFVWEPRGDWPVELVAELCGELGLVHGTDPFVCLPVPGPATYLRLHGRGGYRYRYTDAELDQVAAIVLHRMESQKEVWCLFNNVWMSDDASRLLARMAPGSARRPS